MIRRFLRLLSDPVNALLWVVVFGVFTAIERSYLLYMLVESRTIPSVFSRAGLVNLIVIAWAIVVTALAWIARDRLIPRSNVRPMARKASGPFMRSKVDRRIRERLTR